MRMRRERAVQLEERLCTPVHGKCFGTKASIFRHETGCDSFVCQENEKGHEVRYVWFMDRERRRKIMAVQCFFSEEKSSHVV
jgi:hypothetical protein